MASKIDMSLDQIIKLQGKQKKSNPKTTSNNQSRFRKGQMTRGIRAKPASLGYKPKSRLRPRNAKVSFAGQRLARNIVNRAIINNRRQKIALRPRMAGRNMLAMDREMSQNNLKTIKLQHEVQKLRGAVQLLSGALQRNQRISLNVGNRYKSRPRVFPNAAVTAVQNRLGWKSNRQTVNRNRQFVNTSPNKHIAPNSRVRSTFTNSTTTTVYNTMQSDVVSRDQARQKRLMSDLLALAQSRNLNENNRNVPSRRFQQNTFSLPDRQNFRPKNMPINMAGNNIKQRFVSFPSSSRFPNQMAIQNRNTQYNRGRFNRR